MKRFNLLTRQDKFKFLNNLYFLENLKPVFSLHNFFNHIFFNSISIISTINQSILKGLEILVFKVVWYYDNSTNIDFLLCELKTLVFESKHFLKMFIIKINFKESSFLYPAKVKKKVGIKM